MDSSNDSNLSQSQTTPAQPTLPVIPPLKKRSWSPLAVVLGLATVFFLFFLIISGLMFLSRGPGGGAGRAMPALLSSGGSVGVIELNGVIMDSKKTIARLERFEEDSSIKAVVLRLNSPGGAVAPSQEIYEAVKAYKKPIIASMGSVAASGAYYVACGTKKVFANAGTLTGSIGVIMEFANLEKLYQWAKIQRYVIKTGKFKDVGAEYREMSAEERELMQTLINDVLGQFKKAVSEGRKLKMDDVTRVADGRIFSGSQAKSLKLVDELGTLQDAINEAGKMAGLKGKPNVVYPERPRRRLIEYLFDDNQKEESAESLAKQGLVGSLQQLVLRAVGGTASSSITDQALSPPGLYWLWQGFGK